MNYIYIGKIVNTHGIKGEVRILSDFPYKNEVYKINTNLYIGKKKEQVRVTHYRRHKMFDMLTFDGIDDINDVIKYKGDSIYCNRDEMNFPGLLDDDYIGLKVYDGDKYIGDVTSILKNKPNNILVIENNKNRNLIPNIPEFVKKVNIDDKKIQIESIEGLIHEN